MTRPSAKIIELTEYKPALFPEEEIPYAAAESLWRNYGQQISVEFPSPKTKMQWQLTSQGWIGHIPLTPDLGFALNPKVELANVLRMLEVAYRLKSFRWLEGLIECQTVADFYERLAKVLADRVLERGRKGFYRAYQAEKEPLPYIRGRLDLQQSILTPGEVKLNCHYEVHTTDVEENRILAWTLYRIARTGLCTERVGPTVRRAYRALQGLVTLTPITAQACSSRLYNRLNDDYRSMHALCRFFLEQSGPSHEQGDRMMLPFLVDMAHLYELFVAEWLKLHLPAHLLLKAQERVQIGDSASLQFEIDLMLYDLKTGAASYVLDTKYKTPAKPSTQDIAQVVTYAQAKGCREAILVYPSPLPLPFDELIGDIRVRSLTFLLTGELEAAGRAFLNQLQHGDVAKC